MKRRNPWCRLPSLLLLGLLCAAETQPESGQNAVLRYCEGEPLQALWPLAEANSATRRLAWLIFEPLLERKPLGPGVECNLCESFERQGQSVTFRLKRGVLWHDGTPMGPQDVLFSLRKLDVAAEALDEHTVRLTFRRPVKDPRSELLEVPIVPARFSPEASASAELRARPVGTGPYRFVSHAGPSSVLERFEEYHGPRPGFAQLRPESCRELMSKSSLAVVYPDLDLIPDVQLAYLARIRASDVMKLYSYASYQFAGFTYNCRNPLLAKKEFRRALTTAADRAEWLDSFYLGNGFLVAGPAAPDSSLYDTDLEPLPFDAVKARKMRTDAVGAAPISLKLIVSNDRPGEDLDLLHAYKDALKALDVTVGIVPVEPLVFDETLKKGGFDIAFQVLRLGPGYDFRPNFEGNGTQNPGGYRNEALDQVFARWEAETDVHKLRELARQAQQILAEDCPWTFLWARKDLAAVHQRILGFSAEGLESDHFFTHLERWSVRPD